MIKEIVYQDETIRWDEDENPTISLYNLFENLLYDMEWSEADNWEEFVEKGEKLISEKNLPGSEYNFIRWFMGRVLHTTLRDCKYENMLGEFAKLYIKLLSRNGKDYSSQKEDFYKLAEEVYTMYPSLTKDAKKLIKKVKNFN